MKKILVVIFILVSAAFLVIGCKGMNGRVGKEGEEIIDDSEDKGEEMINPNRIYVNKTTNQFEVSGKRIWINGANTPWNNWGDFGGAYNNSWWNNEFARLKNAGINATRVWINCSNENNAINIDAKGNVISVAKNHWTDVGKLLDLAKTHKIYIMATLLSFDHFKDNNPQGDRWRTMIKNKSAVKSFAENYTIPFARKFRDNPWLWSIDLMNEPDWVHETNKIQWTDISYFMAYNAAAIHKNSNILVTVGMAYPKWMSAQNGNGDYISDSYLKQQYNSIHAYMDFYSPHYYDWVGEWYGVPHYLTPNGVPNKSSLPWTGGWGLNDSKPAVLGEYSAKGTGNQWGFTNNTIITDFQSAYDKGWQGIMPWTSNGVDSNGNLDNMKAATLHMESSYPALIFPMGK